MFSLFLNVLAVSWCADYWVSW